jgi:large subunit ribosomal protein L29
VKSQEAHDLADDQLVGAVGNARQELFNLRFQHATGQLEDTAALGRAKRDLARALTVARERGIDVEREARRQANDA